MIIPERLRVFSPVFIKYKTFTRFSPEHKHKYYYIFFTIVTKKKKLIQLVKEGKNNAKTVTYSTQKVEEYVRAG